jgi:hypothetical protein
MHRDRRRPGWIGGGLPSDLTVNRLALDLHNCCRTPEVGRDTGLVVS